MDVSDYVVLLTDIADGLPRPIIEYLRLRLDDPGRVAFPKSIMGKATGGLRSAPPAHIILPSLRDHYGRLR